MSATDSNTAFRKYTVLVIEDDENARTILSDFLRGLGVQVQTAENGMQGFVKAKESFVDAILLDIMMPRLDGFTVLEKLRNELVHPIPIIMTTALHRREDVQRAMSLGATDYVVKPIDLSVLKEKIAKVIGISPEQLGKLQNENAQIELEHGILRVNFRGFLRLEHLVPVRQEIAEALKKRAAQPPRVVFDFTECIENSVTDAILDTLYAFAEAVEIRVNHVIQITHDPEVINRIKKHPIGNYFRLMEDANKAIELLRKGA